MRHCKIANCNATWKKVASLAFDFDDFNCKFLLKQNIATASKIQEKLICSTTLHRGGGALTMCSLIPSVWADNHDEKMLVACQCSHMLTWFPIISISLFSLGTIFYMQQLRSCMDLITCESELHCRVSRMPCPMLIHMGNGYAMMH